MRSNLICSGLTFTMFLAISIGSCGWLTEAQAQERPIRHEFIRSDMHPGEAAYYYKMANRGLVGHIQPVQVITPDGCNIEIGGSGQYSSAEDSTVTLGMAIGPVYRFRVSKLPIPGAKGALYPSIEVINRLYPPEGLQQQFPIQVMIGEDDLRHALEGRMVTKVIYLEDPHGTLPHKHMPGQQPSFDVGGGEDPLRAAEQLGRPMAILRIGSRVPMANDPTEKFDFGTPAPQILASPEVSVRYDKNYMRQMREGGSAVPRSPMAKPMLPGNLYDALSKDNAAQRRSPVATTQRQSSQPADHVALAAKAQYEAAVAEAAKQKVAQAVANANVAPKPAPVQKASAVAPMRLKHPLPAPIIKSDVIVPAKLRRPDQLNQF